MRSRVWLPPQRDSPILVLLDGVGHAGCSGLVVRGMGIRKGVLNYWQEAMATRRQTPLLNGEAKWCLPAGSRYLRVSEQVVDVVCKMLLQIQHDLGLSPGSAADAEAHAIKLLKLYKHSLSLCKGLDPKEKAPGDDLIPLAVASLMAARKLDMAGSTSIGTSAGLGDRLVEKRMMQVTAHILFDNC